MASNSSFRLLGYHCSDCTGANMISMGFLITHMILLLPLSLLVLCLGLERWRRQRFFTTTPHSDVFTFHSAAMDIIFVLGAVLFCSGLYLNVLEIMRAGFLVTSNFFSGHISLHILTCVECYLAVVHPVTYLGLRQSGGVRIRNKSLVCVWLLYWGWLGVEVWYYPEVPYVPIFCILASSLVVVSFCSLSVLCVLIHPGPGDTGGKREPNNQSKQRAFCTITAITAVLWLYFLGFLLCVAVENAKVLSYTAGCLLLMSGMWFSVPSTLILPLLFLHRTRNMLSCHCSNI